MKEHKNYVIGIGEVLLDCFPNGEKKLGGAPTIFAYHAAQSGWDGLVISAIGEDVVVKDEKLNGGIIENELKEHNLESRLAIIKGKPLGVAEVDNHDCNNPSYTIDKNSAWSEIKIPNADLDEIATQTKAVYFGTLASFCGKTTKRTIDVFLKKLDDVSSGCWKIYDVNHRINPDGTELYSEELVLEYISKCNVLKVNLDELKYICESLNIKESGEMKKCKEIMNRYSSMRYLILTLGEDGSSIFWRDEDHENKISFSSLGMPANVKNTVGAGDALAGAFIGEILRGKTPEHAHRIAVECSAVVCEEGASMPKMNRSDVFLSYDRADKDIVLSFFGNRLREKKLSYWIDEENIIHGDYFGVEIEKAIRDSEVFLFFYSKNSKRSEWVHREIKIAQKYNKKIIPIILDNLEDVPYDKRNKMYDKYVDTVLKDVHHLDYSISKLDVTIKDLLKIQST